MSSPNFDLVAPYYDFLVRIIFGKTLWSAQQIHLDKIKRKDRVLILGGGTGRILKWLPENCKITYLDMSERMIKRAKRNGKAKFITTNFLSFNVDEEFDWILCPFFLDCFPEKELKAVLKKIHGLLKNNGGIIVTDFHVSNSSQKLVMSLMICFFKLMSRLKILRLLSVQEVISDTHFELIETKSFRREFIFSNIYRKKETF